MRLRHIVQVMVMVGDLIFWLLCAWLLIRLSPELKALVIVAIWAWFQNGGWMAWKPANIRDFMANAKRYGL